MALFESHQPHTDERFTPQGQGFLWKAIEPLKIYKHAGQQLLATVPKGLVVEELEKQGDWVRHYKGWSPATEKGKVVLWPLNTCDKPLWVVTKDVNIRSKANFTSSVAGRLSAGVLVEELAKEGNWIKHSKGWSVVYSEKEQTTHIIPFTPLPHEQREHYLQLKAQNTAAKQVVQTVYLPPQTYYQPPTGSQPQVQVVYAPAAYASPGYGYAPTAQVVYAPQPVYHAQGQPMYAPQGQPQGQPMYALQGQPQGQPMYAPQGQPMYAPQGQPMYAPQGQPTIPIYSPQVQATLAQPTIQSSPQPLAQPPSYGTVQPPAAIPNIMDQEVPSLREGNTI